MGKEVEAVRFFFHVDAFHAGFFLASLSHHYGGPVRTDGGLIFTAAALRERRVFSKFTHTHKHRRDLFLSLLYGRPFVVMAAFVHCLSCVKCTVRFTVPHSGTGVSRSQCAGRFCNFLWQVFPFLLTPPSLTVSR